MFQKTMKETSRVDEENTPEQIDEYARWSSSNMSDSTVDEECDELEILVDKKAYGDEKKRQKNGQLSLWNAQWLPDGPWKIGQVQFLDYPSVKLFKFFVVTIALMLMIHYYAILAVRLSSS
jgi:hypothetical protein